MAGALGLSAGVDGVEPVGVLAAAGAPIEAVATELARATSAIGLLVLPALSRLPRRPLPSLVSETSSADTETLFWVAVFIPIWGTPRVMLRLMPVAGMAIDLVVPATMPTTWSRLRTGMPRTLIAPRLEAPAGSPEPAPSTAWALEVMPVISRSGRPLSRPPAPPVRPPAPPVRPPRRLLPPVTPPRRPESGPRFARL